METLVLDGKNYVKASKAARDLGYATDYVGQLCRSGKVSAHLIGRTWYVNADELGTHRVEKKRMSRIKARESAHKSIEAHRLKISTTPNTYKNIDIQYEQDSEELIPQTKKLLVQTSVDKHYVEKASTDTRPTYVNKGQKVHMSGSVTVVDVTDGVVDEDTTLLSPTLLRKQSTKKDIKETLHVRVNEESDSNEIAEPAPDFKTRIEISTDGELADLDKKDEEEVLITAPRDISETQIESSVLPYILIVILVTSLTVLSVFLSLKIQYQSDDVPNIATSYNFSLDKTLALFRLRI